MDDTSGRIDIDGARPRSAADIDIANGSARATESGRESAAAAAGGEVEHTKRMREEIVNTRGDMTETIEAIQEKLKPANIVANATERVKIATTERVREMADTTSRTAQEAMDYTRETANKVVDATRQNPIPLALLGLGAAWWLNSRARNSSSSSGEGAMAKATSRAGEYASEAAASARRIARQRKNQLQRTLEQNPLLVGASALILGAAFGFVAPETETENEWMGEARDTVIDRARDIARDAANKVQDAAGSLAEGAMKLSEQPQP